MPPALAMKARCNGMRKHWPLDSLRLLLRKKRPQSLVKNNFGRGAGIGATQNDCKGCLPFHQSCSVGLNFPWLAMRGSGNKAAVAVDLFLQGFFGWNHLMRLGS